MTGTQIGTRISRMSAPQKSKKKDAAKEGKRLLQLMICAAIFVSLVAAKLVLPQQMQRLGSAISAVMAQNMDARAVFSAIGQAVSGEKSVGDSLGSVYQAVFHPDAGIAVETSAQLEGSTAAPVGATLLRAFSEGRGKSLAPFVELPEKVEQTVAASDLASAPPATQAKATPEPLPPADEALPANVRMEQQLLNFKYCTPVVGALSSPFGYREHPTLGSEKFHYGIDLAADTGTKIEAFAAGTVTAVGESSSLGKYVMLAHKNGYSTLYAHCSKICVSSGAAVKLGEKLAEVGETGFATGPHLHFEIQKDGAYLNPIYYVTLA